jgi:WD40 repeat protein
MSNITAMTFSPDGAFLFTGESNGGVLMWDLAEGVVVQRFDVNSSSASGSQQVTHISISPDGRLLLVSGHPGTDQVLWQVGYATSYSAMPTTGVLLARFPHIGASGTVFSPDSRTAVVGETINHEALVLDVAFGPEEQRWFGHRAYMTRAVFSPDGQTMLSSDQSGGLILWDATSGRQIRQMRGYGGAVTNSPGIAFTPDGQAVVTLAEDSNLILLDINTGEILRRFGSYGYSNLALSPDGSMVAVENGTGIIIWDVATGEEARRLTSIGGNGIAGSITGVAFSPDGETLISTSSDNIMILWDMTTGEVRQQFPEAPADEVAFSPDGQTVLTVDTEEAVMLWDIQTQAMRWAVPGDAVSAAFSPDGNTILMATEDSIALLDTATGLPIRRWQADVPLFSRVAFSPDGNYALTGDWDSNSIVVWRIDSVDGLIDWVHNNRYVPELTCGQQEQYRADPYCDENGVYPSRTPFPTWTPSPTVDLTQTTATLTASVSPIPPTLANTRAPRPPTEFIAPMTATVAPIAPTLASTRGPQAPTAALAPMSATVAPIPPDATRSPP